jgi:hypothetical protein
MRRGMELFNTQNPAFAGTVSLTHVYLNMDPENKNRQKCELYNAEIQSTQRIIENQKPDLIILSGDMAQKLVGTRLVSDANLKAIIENLAKQGGCTARKDQLIKTLTPLQLEFAPKLVFVDVTTSNVAEYGYIESPNISGIYKHLSADAVRDTLEDIYNGIPEAKKPAELLILGDPPSMEQQSIKNLERVLKEAPLPAPLQWKRSETAVSWSDWQIKVRRANKNNSMIFIAGYDTLASAETTRSNVVRWTEYCMVNAPVIGSVESFIADGGMLSITMSDQEQGFAALEMARDPLDSKPAPFRESKQFTIGINFHLLAAKRAISLPAIYESFSRENGLFLDQTYPYSANCE